jgi:exodeoxyribonuclease V gamma subunit
MLHLHRAERADALAGALRDVLAVPQPDPFAREVVAVPTRGMERWLTQRLSGGLGASPGRADGVCANVEFPPPARLAADAVAVASGIDPERDPWLPERAIWPLLRVIAERLDEPWLARLATHLGEPDDAARRGRRLAVVRHLAGLFDAYALHRPALLAAWAAGEDGGIPEDARWQADVWRALRERIGTPGPAERRAAACRRLREAPELLDLPPRLAAFGLTRLPAGHLAVLDAIAAHRDVHLLLLHPSPALWSRVAARLAAHGPVTRRVEDPTAALPRHPLLASWGHDARELQVVLAGAPGAAAHHHSTAAPPATLLGRIQAAVRGDVPPPGEPLPGAPDERPALAAGDRSIQVHACHGRARQVEVLRDAVLHLLEDDPTLEPRDVLVMCPDIEAFAPLLQATFGVAGRDGAPDLRVRLADRALRRTNPVLAVVARLLELADARVTVSEVLDLADRAPVRRRHRFEDDDLERMEEWIERTGIRWGLDAAHRAPFKLDQVPAGTWRAGLDRLLLGVTMSEDGLRRYGGVLPLDDVESGAIDLAGRFADLVDALGAALDRLAGPQPLGDWAAALGDAADALVDTAPRDAWQRLELGRVLGDLVDEAEGDATPLALHEIRGLLAERLRGRPTRANFRTGHLTVCTLVPMRSVPHRVVCLLGLDDGQFPRRSARDGDDLLLASPHVGERDARTEDRQQLLDALLAATEHLVVTYAGADERTNLPRPPAVPVGELLDVVDRTVRSPDARPPRAHILVRHPLQPFDPRNFAPGALVPERSWSFDGVTLRGAEAMEGPRVRPAPFLEAPLPAGEAEVVELADVVAFVDRPVRAFLRQRLELGVSRPEEEGGDELPITLPGLERWAIGDRILEALLAGITGRRACLAEIARGTLPPGLLGSGDVATAYDLALEIAGLVPPGEAASLDVRVPLAGGRVLSGTVAGLVGDALRTATYSRVGPQQRLGAWVRLLALTAARPERAFSAVTVGRGPYTPRGPAPRVRIARIPPLAASPEERRETALHELAILLDLHARGLREPPPLARDTSAAYADAAHKRRDKVVEARDAWEKGRLSESRQPEHVLVHGGEIAFVDLTAPAPRPDEAGPGWDPDETRRFGRWSRRLWDGLLSHERIEDRR